jgi:hypothetical protein
VGKDLQDLATQAANDAQEQSQAAFRELQKKAMAKAAELTSAAGGLNSNTRDDDDDSSGLLKILRMIFKIVPIGINIVKNTKTLKKGFEKTAAGLIALIKNLAITTIIFGVDTIRFTFELGYMAFKTMICSVGGMLNLHKCILFYLFDFVVLFLILVLTSILFMLDIFFSVKLFLGISCVELLIFGFDSLEEFDKWVFQWAGAHLVHYPDFVMNLCYKCSSSGDSSGFSYASKKIYNDIFVMIPNKIGSPIGNIVRGIGQIFGFFNLS